jgi:hypothetical protein
MSGFKTTFLPPSSSLFGAHPEMTFSGFALSALTLQRSAKRYKNQTIKLIAQS